MNRLEKLRQARAAAADHPELSIVFAVCSGLRSADLELVRNTFPSVDEEYLRFLSEAAGLQVDMHQVFGSKETGLTPLSIGWDRWRPIIQRAGVPIGADPSGDCIVQCNDRRICLVSHDRNGVDEGRVIASPLSELLADVFMGPRFRALFPTGWTSAHENEWSRFLRSRGWFDE